MNTAQASGFTKEAGLKDWAGVGLGALGLAVGGAGLYMASEGRKDTSTMRHQSRAADALHSAMLFESRTGQRLRPGMRKQIGLNYMRANQKYRGRFSQAPTASAEGVEKTSGMRRLSRIGSSLLRKHKGKDKGLGLLGNTPRHQALSRSGAKLDRRAKRFSSRSADLADTKGWVRGLAAFKKKHPGVMGS